MTLRFIEYMDVGHSNGWRLDEVVPADELIDAIDRGRWPARAGRARATAARSPDRWRYLDGRGEFGVISSVTRPFCRDCTRARLSADGKLYTCLFAVDGRDVRAVLRDGPTDEALVDVPGGDLARARRPLFRAALAGDDPTCPRSRCSRWAAEIALVHTVIHTSTTASPNSWTASAQSVRSSWITALTRADAGRYRRSCPKGPTGTQEPRSHQGPSFRRSVASGASLPGARGRLTTARPRGPPDGTRSASRCRYFRRAHEALPDPRPPPVMLGATLGGSMSDVAAPIDPARPIPPVAQPDRLAALVAAVRAQPTSSRRSGSCWAPGSAGSPTTSRTPSRSRSRSCPAGRRRPRPGTSAGCCWAGSAGRAVVMLQGRFHLYEGNDPGLVVQPVLLFRALGAADRRPDQRGRRARSVVRPGDAHGHDRPHQPDRPNPLIGPNADELGPRFPDLTDAWSPRLRAATACGRRAREGVELREGVYVGLTGPTLRDAGRGPDARRRSAGTRSGCRRCSSASPRAGSASRSAASRS